MTEPLLDVVAALSAKAERHSWKLAYLTAAGIAYLVIEAATS